MADIALLVMEEFERRKRFEIGHGVEEKQSSVILCSLKKKSVEVEKMMEFAKKALEPKSHLGFALSEGFFCP
ncbi:hypothetical protein IHE45_08G036900 [Dioscorea alata]|uniref:Uncharacterized protein n=1 Tax=Dioscorea alata TaxID=55571 RepID=A0ACB7VI26_DIOAL|nr:hypothetical protein IHE45_08G036900 [Dioscorea alata]